MVYPQANLSSPVMLPFFTLGTIVLFTLFALALCRAPHDIGVSSHLLGAIAFPRRITLRLRFCFLFRAPLLCAAPSLPANAFARANVSSPSYVTQYPGSPDAHSAVSSS